jgi:hypothetical protein
VIVPLSELAAFLALPERAAAVGSLDPKVMPPHDALFTLSKALDLLPYGEQRTAAKAAWGELMAFMQRLPNRADVGPGPDEPHNHWCSEPCGADGCKGAANR